MVIYVICYNTKNKNTNTAMMMQRNANKNTDEKLGDKEEYDV